MINTITKYFTLNRRERNGIMLLSTLILILIAVKYFVVYQYKTKADRVVIVYLDEIAAKLEVQKIISPEKQNFSNEKTTEAAQTLFYFDPNTVREEQAVKLGFSEKSARTFMNYRAKGAKFYKAEDLKKLYGMTDRLYEKLAPYILIEQRKEEKTNFTEKKSTSIAKQEITLEINSADSTEWLKLKGIGPGYTHRILKYKSLLGGFTNVEQLKEVYNFSDSLYNAIKNNLTVNPSLVKKLKVNSAEFKTLVHHPYIKYEGTKCIFALKRDKKIKAEDLINSSCFSREMLAKVLPYLNFE